MYIGCAYVAYVLHIPVISLRTPYAPPSTPGIPIRSAFVIVFELEDFAFCSSLSLSLSHSPHSLSLSLSLMIMMDAFMVAADVESPPSGPVQITVGQTQALLENWFEARGSRRIEKLVEVIRKNVNTPHA